MDWILSAGKPNEVEDTTEGTSAIRKHKNVTWYKKEINSMWKTRFGLKYMSLQGGDQGKKMNTRVDFMGRFQNIQATPWWLYRKKDDYGSFRQEMRVERAWLHGRGTGNGWINIGHGRVHSVFSIMELTIHHSPWEFLISTILSALAQNKVSILRKGVSLESEGIEKKYFGRREERTGEERRGEMYNVVTYTYLFFKIYIFYR